jgi:tRNA pseudouridine55 synthase
VDGERAYARVRRGETITLAPRTVQIDRLDLLGWDPQQGRLELEVECSGGTYIRSLARDLGDALGCGGTLAQLRRTAALGFDLHQAIPLRRLEEGPPPPLLDPLEALSHLPRRPLTAAELAGWRCGRTLGAANGGATDQPVAVLTPDGNLAGIARADGQGGLRPRLVLDAAG